jgi:hypothetical protein
VRAAVVVLAALVAIPATAQQAKKPAPAPAEPLVTSWEVTLGGAGGFGSSTADMDGALRASGYAPSTSGDFLSATLFPSVRFALGERAALGVSFSSTKLGSTTGTTTGGGAVSIQRSSMDVALVGFWRPFPGVRVGAGPAWYRLTAAPAGGPDLTASKLGWIAEAGIALPEGKRFYADFALQWRGTGSADFGTYVPPANGPVTPAAISLDGISCAHAAFIAGLGLRF